MLSFHKWPTTASKLLIMFQYSKRKEGESLRKDPFRVSSCCFSLPTLKMKAAFMSRKGVQSIEVETAIISISL